MTGGLRAPTWSRLPWSTAQPGAWPARRRGWFVRLEFDGVVGIGEAAPMPGYNDDSYERAAEALDRAFSTPPFEALAFDVVSVDSGPNARLDLDALLPSLARIAASSPAAACALETAILDHIGRRRGQSIASLLAGTTPLRRVPVNAVATPATIDAFARRWDAGVRAVKLKVGRGDHASELRAAAALRERFGPQLELRLDANGGWQADEATGALADYVPLDVAFCEQPVPAGALADYLRTGPPIPIAADESMGVPDEADALLGPNSAAAPAVVVLKPMALGGALRCVKLAERAAAASIPCVVTHMLDGPIGAACAAELAAALPGRVLASGLAWHPNLGGWTGAPPQLGHGDAGTGGRPGHGLIAEALLDEATT